MSCRCAGHVRCTKETAFSVTASEAATRQFLKAWAILGEGLPSRSEHMGARLRQSLLDALHNGTLMDETRLDMLVMENADIMAPFLPSVAPSISASSTSLLGDHDSQVDEATHEEMERLAREGAIPVPLGSKGGGTARHITQHTEFQRNSVLLWPMATFLRI